MGKGLGGALSSLAGPVRRKKYSDKIKRSDPFLKKIYSHIIEFDQLSVKTKPEKLKVQRNQIIKHLRKRYGPQMTDKIMATIHFSGSMTFDEYCKSIEDFISKDVDTKKRFGFRLHDFNSDGRICPVDIAQSRDAFSKEFGFLHWFDLSTLNTLMQDQVEQVPVKKPGYHLPEFEAEFDEEWKAKQAGIKRKRPRVVIDDPAHNNDLMSTSEKRGLSTLPDNKRMSTIADKRVSNVSAINRDIRASENLSMGNISLVGSVQTSQSPSPNRYLSSISPNKKSL